MSTDVDDFLAHYGIKGMKWGVIRKKDKAPIDAPEGDPRPKSHYRTMVEATYLKRGYSLQDAEIKAEKVIKVQKIVAITAGVTVAAVGGYVVAQKLGKEFTGVHIKQGTTLQHISKSDTLSLNDQHLYTTFKKADKFNYQGTFATELGALTGTQTYAVRLASTKAIKAPSNVQGRRLLETALNKKVSPQDYRDFVNSMHRPSSSQLDRISMFKETLRSNGFNAVIDTTDQRRYAKAVKPLIVFNSNQNLVDKGSRALRTGEVAGKVLATRLSQLTTDPDTLKVVGIGSGILGVTAGSNYASQKTQIDRYLAKHPNTKLTRSQVAVTLGLTTS